MPQVFLDTPDSKGENGMIERGGFYFYMVADVVVVWLGKPREPESERVMEINEDYLPQLIAGLTAMKAKQNNRKD
jgi:hypothetical protein